MIQETFLNENYILVLIYNDHEIRIILIFTDTYFLKVNLFVNAAAIF